MGLEDVSIRLFILLAPGILGTVILVKLTPGKLPDPFYFTMSSSALGLFSYVLVFLLQVMWASLAPIFGLGQATRSSSGFLLDPQVPIDYGLVAAATVVGVAIGFALAMAVNSNRAFAVFRKLGLTNQTGFDGIWPYIHKMVPGAQWVTIRDLASGLVFDGQFLRQYMVNNSPGETPAAKSTPFKMKGGVKVAPSAPRPPPPKPTKKK
ncbi:MAG: hypothetical protein LC620_08130 [Halobacteriales archaeon]|nr:hypothetical protein [Halobacteriales archaeon]